MDSQQPQRRTESAPRKGWEPVPWEKDLPFRILSIDGGGIKGIFPAAVLASLEQECLEGETIGDYFDLVAGTSTGGIIALGLGAGMTASEILGMYLEEGHLVFPSTRPCVPISHERPHEAPVVLIPHPGGGQRVKCQLSATKPDHSSINVRRRSNRSDRA